METNPYQPPVSVETTREVDPADAVMIRRAHLPHEIIVKCIGAYWIMCTALAGWHVWSYLQSMPDSGIQWEESLTWILILATVVALLKAFTAVYLMRLARWSTIAATILALTSIWGFSFACIVNLFLLFTLWSKKGRKLYTPFYQQIVAATPEVKCRKTPSFKLLFIILTIAIIFPILSDLYARSTKYSVTP